MAKVAVAKVTVSLPGELFAHIEKRRHETSVSRSEVVSDLLWRGWRQLEDEHREARYRATYHAQPDTAEELEWADLAAGELLAKNRASADLATEPATRGRRAAR